MPCWTKRKLKLLVLYAIIGIIICNFFGIFTHLFEKDFYTAFQYPLNEDIIPYIEQLKNNDVPSKNPTNSYNYSFVTNIDTKCGNEPLRLVILIKSALGHFEQRKSIRSSYGFEHRFSDVAFKTVFLLGVNSDNSQNDIQKQISLESKKYNDIVQVNFVDTYYNNTIKTMMGFKWAMKYCPNSRYYLFSDDDMYISIKNVLRFIRNPANYPKYLTEGFTMYKDKGKVKNRLKRSTHILNSTGNCTSESCTPTREKRQVQYYDLPDDVSLYAGYMFHSSPHRHKISKWYVSLDEYPFHLWPPYISAGAYILSKEAFTTMYYASYYTTHFRFDDIYLGILAKKSGITPFHSNDFYFYKKPYNKLDYKYVIASHGYGNPDELLKIWNEQKEAGNA